MDQQKVAGKIITAKCVADILGKDIKTVERWRKEGKGPRWYQPEGKGGSVYYLAHEVTAYALGLGGVA